MSRKTTVAAVPAFMKTHSTSLGAEKDFDQMRPGDIVFTNRANKAVLAARERGVYVVCVTINYWNNEFRPRGYNHVSHGCPDGLMLKDVSNEILHSHTPYEQGLVHAPEIPEFAICPSSGTGSGSIHWMLNAEIANKLAHPNAKAVDKSAQYLRVLTERVQRTRSHFDRIRETTAIMAERVRAGGRWFGKSIEHPGFESEFHVASGVAVVNFGNWDANREKKRHVHQLHLAGLSGRGEVGPGETGGRRLRGGRRTRLPRTAWFPTGGSSTWPTPDSTTSLPSPGG